MDTYPFKLHPNNQIHPCPQCGNNTDFIARSARYDDYLFELWIECRCGHEPTSSIQGSRYETTLPGFHSNELRIALSCWNGACEEAGKTQNDEQSDLREKPGSAE